MHSEGNLAVFKTNESDHLLRELILRQKSFSLKEVPYRKGLFDVDWENNSSLLRIINDEILAERNGLLEIPVEYWLRDENIHYGMWFEKAEIRTLREKDLKPYQVPNHIIVVYNPPRF